MSLISNTFVLSTLAALGSATIISSDFRIPGIAIGLGTFNAQTTIEAGASYWLSGLGTHNIYGDLTVNGALTISQTDWLQTQPGGQTCDWTGGSLANLGSILLNDVSALSAPTYNWWLDNIKNEGTIQWCGRGDTGGSTYHMSSKKDLINDGLIVFEQVRGNWGTAMTFQNTVPTISALQASSNVYNNGGFLIRKARLDIMQQILGYGCWMIDTDAILYLQDGLSAFNNYGYKPSLNGQSVSFIGASGTLHMDTAVYSRNKLFGAKVFNFGIGHSIEFYETIKGISYDGLAGVLTVSFYSKNSVNIEIGKGYDGSKFSFSARASFYASFNAVFYSGQAPSQSVPDKCQLTADTCGPVTGPQPTSSVPAPVSTSSRIASTLSTRVSSSPYGGQSSSSAAVPPSTSSVAPLPSTSSAAPPSSSVPSLPPYGQPTTSIPSLPPYGQPSTSAASSSQGIATSSARVSSTISAVQSSSSSFKASSSSPAVQSSSKASSSSPAVQSSSSSSSSEASSSSPVVQSSSSSKASSTVSAAPTSSSSVKTSSSASIPVYPGASSSSAVVSSTRSASTSTSPSASPVRSSSTPSSGPSTSSAVISSRPASTGASSCAAQITVTSVVSAPVVTSTVTVQAGPVVSTLTLPAVTSTVTLPAVTVTQPAVTITKKAATVTVTKKAGTKTVTKVATVTSCPGGYPSSYDDDNSGYDSYGLPSYDDDNSGYDSY